MIEYDIFQKALKKLELQYEGSAHETEKIGR